MSISSSNSTEEDHLAKIHVNVNRKNESKKEKHQEKPCLLNKGSLSPNALFQSTEDSETIMTNIEHSLAVLKLINNQEQEQDLESENKHWQGQWQNNALGEKEEVEEENSSKKENKKQKNGGEGKEESNNIDLQYIRKRQEYLKLSEAELHRLFRTCDGIINQMKAKIENLNERNALMLEKLPSSWPLLSAGSQSQQQLHSQPYSSLPKTESAITNKSTAIVHTTLPVASYTPIVNETLDQKYAETSPKTDRSKIVAPLSSIEELSNTSNISKGATLTSLSIELSENASLKPVSTMELTSTSTAIDKEQHQHAPVATESQVALTYAAGNVQSCGGIESNRDMPSTEEAARSASATEVKSTITTTSTQPWLNPQSLDLDLPLINNETALNGIIQRCQKIINRINEPISDSPDRSEMKARRVLVTGVPEGLSVKNFLRLCVWGGDVQSVEVDYQAKQAQVLFLRPEAATLYYLSSGAGIPIRRTENEKPVQYMLNCEAMPKKEPRNAFYRQCAENRVTRSVEVSGLSADGFRQLRRTPQFLAMEPYSEYDPKIQKAIFHFPSIASAYVFHADAPKYVLFSQCVIDFAKDQCDYLKKGTPHPVESEAGAGVCANGNFKGSLRAGIEFNESVRSNSSNSRGRKRK